MLYIVTACLQVHDFFDACNSYTSEVHEREIHALISERFLCIILKLNFGCEEDRKLEVKKNPR